MILKRKHSELSTGDIKMKQKGGYCWFHSPVPDLPVVQEESVLDEDVEGEVHKALNSHETKILPDKVPLERIHFVVLPCTVQTAFRVLFTRVKKQHGGFTKHKKIW